MDASTVTASILAHQGGWDEILLVAGPIVVVVGLLALAKRRIERAAVGADDADRDADHTDAHSGRDDVTH